MEDQINLVMPKIKKMEFCSATDDEGWESFVWTIKPFDELAADAAELLFDGTRAFLLSFRFVQWRLTLLSAIQMVRLLKTLNS